MCFVIKSWSKSLFSVKLSRISKDTIAGYRRRQGTIKHILKTLLSIKAKSRLLSCQSHSCLSSLNTWIMRRENTDKDVRLRCYKTFAALKSIKLIFETLNWIIKLPLLSWKDKTKRSYSENSLQMNGSRSWFLKYWSSIQVSRILEVRSCRFSSHNNKLYLLRASQCCALLMTRLVLLTICRPIC